MEPCETLVCVGDIHGNVRELTLLWAKLERRLGGELDTACVVFLGDYCDRGPDTRQVLDWLIQLQAARAQKGARTHFLAGNHDLGMAAYLGCLPAGRVPEDLDGTRDPRFTSGFFAPSVEGGMHYVGRRWGGSHSYNAETAFASYGVAFEFTAEARQALLAAVPAAHKRFLAELAWVHEEPCSFGPVVCVHAGLLQGPLAPQLQALRARDLADPSLWEQRDPGRLAPLSGRQNVLAAHPDLPLVVSGHHGGRVLEKGRIVIDSSGGQPSLSRPLEAVVVTGLAEEQWELVVHESWQDALG